MTDDDIELCKHLAKGVIDESLAWFYWENKRFLLVLLDYFYSIATNSFDTFDEKTGI